MEISLEFIDFVVPVALIKKKYPGGWEKCLEDHANLINTRVPRVWYDDYLFRDGAMNPMDIQSLVEEWSEMGFEPFEEVDGEKHWKDFCVVESLLGGATLSCEWLAIGENGRSAYYKGTYAGELKGRPPKQS